MSTLGRIATVIALCGLALGYLYQHNCSLRLARQLSTLEKERQLLLEELDSIDVDIAQLTSFGRMESLWAAEVPAAMPQERVVRAAGGPPFVAAHYAEAH
jgi:hypothetical protein